MRKCAIIVILVILFLITGCKDKKYIECTLNVNNNVQNYTLTGTYKIYYKKGYITNIEKYDEYKSSDTSILEYLNESNSLYYYNLNDKYGGVTYDIKSSTNSVIIKTSLNVKEMDVSKLYDDKILDEQYINHNKITTGEIKRFYQSKGAVCIEK